MRPMGMSLLSWVPLSSHSVVILSLSPLHAWIQTFCKDDKMLLWNSIWSEGVQIGYNPAFGKSWGIIEVTTLTGDPGYCWALDVWRSVGQGCCVFGRQLFSLLFAHWIVFTLVKGSVSQAWQGLQETSASCWLNVPGLRVQQWLLLSLFCYSSHKTFPKEARYMLKFKMKMWQCGSVLCATVLHAWLRSL